MFDTRPISSWDSHTLGSWKHPPIPRDLFGQNGWRVVVSFDDGKTALYSASLLRAMLPQAKQMNDADLGEQRS
jgi:hypothetical protein